MQHPPAFHLTVVCTHSSSLSRSPVRDGPRRSLAKPDLTLTLVLAVSALSPHRDRNLATQDPIIALEDSLKKIENDKLKFHNYTKACNDRRDQGKLQMEAARKLKDDLRESPPALLLPLHFSARVEATVAP